MDHKTVEELRRVESALHTDDRSVRFQDVDAAGIVFYARVFSYFHDSYAGFLRERGAPLERALRDGSWAAPLRSAEAEFLRPLRFGDEIGVSIVSADLDETEYAIGYRIDSSGEVACVGRTVHVSVNPRTFRRATIPPALRTALEGAGAAEPGGLAGPPEPAGPAEGAD